VRAVDDGRRVIVALRQGVRWHDGRPLTAGDVAFTYEFLRARRQPRFLPQLRAILSVRALDRQTVEFRLRHRSIGFADQPLADVPILPEHLWRGLAPGLRAPAGAPIGSGPYRVVGREAGGTIQLAAVSDYFRGRPRADRVEIPVVPDAVEMLVALRRGRVDTVPFTLTPAQQARVRSVSIRIAEGPLFLGTMLMFNVRRAPFHQLRVRRAVAAALDIGRIARGTGAGMPAMSGLLHPRSRWAPKPKALRRPPAGRPLAGLALPQLRVLAPANDPVRREAGRQVVLSLRRAGASARLVTLSRERLGRAVGEGGGRASFELAIWSIPSLASFDPDYLAALFGTRRAGGSLNRSGYGSRAFDRLAATVGAAPTVPARRRAVAAMLARLDADVPVVPLLFSDGRFAYRATSPVGWTFHAGAGILDKQSLLRPAPDRSAIGAPASGTADDDDAGISLFAVVGGAMLALALLLAGAAALVRRR
jgi:peptide/nickel transport system substrate-binding protein